jgi:riboflavin kinase/FMN adenylyltransferase
MVVLRHPPARAAHPVALTVGNFDGVHLGHRAMIAHVREAAHALGVRACVMTFEPHPREFFTPALAPTRLTSLREKLEQLAALAVDQVLVCRFDHAFARMEPAAFIDAIVDRGLAARYVLVGDDFRFGAGRVGDYDLLSAAGRERGFTVERMPTFALDGVRVSSTKVRERLAAGDLERAAALLGRAYSVSGRVVHGEKLGVKLGFPTANVRMEHNRPPLMGIFVVEVCGLGGAWRPGVASLGVRPTITSGSPPVLEVHLLDFQGSLYGRRIEVRFVCKLRDEEKYPDLPSLQAAIARDVERAKAYFEHRGTQTHEGTQAS